MLGSRDAGRDPDLVAIDALGFLAANEDLLNRFLALSGLSGSELRSEAKSPSFFVWILDFLLANEEDLVAFASSIGIAPSMVGRIRNQLAVKAGIALEDYPA